MQMKADVFIWSSEDIDDAFKSVTIDVVRVVSKPKEGSITPIAELAIVETVIFLE